MIMHNYVDNLSNIIYVQVYYDCPYQELMSGEAAKEHAVADLENVVGRAEHLLAACGRWSLSNRQ